MATRTTATQKKRNTATAVKKTAAKKTTTKKAATGKTVSTKKSTTTKAAAAKGASKSKAAAKTATTKRVAKTTKAKRSKANVASGPGLGQVYEKRSGEEYMNKTQLEHFREKLLTWKEEILQDLTDTMNHLREDAKSFADPNDRATQESEFALELRTRDRERKLLRKIDQALARIADGSYGYCDETGEEIGLARLEIRPVATMSVEAQERRERSERQYADAR